MNILFNVIVFVFIDNRGEISLPAAPHAYVIGGVRYVVSPVYKSEGDPAAKTLRIRFEHLVKTGCIGLNPSAGHDIMTTECVPAATKKGE